MASDSFFFALRIPSNHFIKKTTGIKSTLSPGTNEIFFDISTPQKLLSLHFNKSIRLVME